MSDNGVGNGRQGDLTQTGIQLVLGAVPRQNTHRFGYDEILVVNVRIETRAVLGEDQVRCVGECQFDLDILYVGETGAQTTFDIDIAYGENELIFADIDCAEDILRRIAAQIVKGQMLQAEEIKHKADDEDEC